MEAHLEPIKNIFDFDITNGHDLGQFFFYFNCLKCFSNEYLIK